MSTFKAILPVLALLLGGCDVTDPGFEQTGVVHRVEVSGGCWVIDAASGVRYEPTNLPASFRVDGLEVAFRGQVRSGHASICMVGQILELSSIEQTSG